MKAKELIGMVASNKKIGNICLIAGALIGAVGKGIQHVVEKNEAEKLIEKLVNDKLAGK